MVYLGKQQQAKVHVGKTILREGEIDLRLLYAKIYSCIDNSKFI